MADILGTYSIQSWLESCPQGYLAGTVDGHGPFEREPEPILGNEVLRELEIRTTVQIVLKERCALGASSGLINAAPDEASKRFLATQTLDEARHIEIFTRRLCDLGVRKDDVEDVIQSYANPSLLRFAELLMEKVDQKDFVAGVVCQNVILEGLAFRVFELMHAANENVNPKFAHTLSGTIADERRHVEFGEVRIGSLVHEHPEKKPEIQRLQRELSSYMLATFADMFHPGPAERELQRARGTLARAAGADEPTAPWHGANLAKLSADELEKLFAGTVLNDFKTRLGRIGIEYQTPVRL